MLEQQHVKAMEDLEILIKQKELALNNPTEYLDFLSTSAEGRTADALERINPRKLDARFRICPSLQTLYSLPKIDFLKYRAKFSINRRGDLSSNEEKVMEGLIQKLLTIQESQIGQFKVLIMAPSVLHTFLSRFLQLRI